MGLGFTDGLILPRNSEPKLEVPTSSYGLSIRQLAALGLTEDSIAKPLEANEVRLVADKQEATEPCGLPGHLLFRFAGVHNCEGLL